MAGPFPRPLRPVAPRSRPRHRPRDGWPVRWARTSAAEAKRSRARPEEAQSRGEKRAAQKTSAPRPPWSGPAAAQLRIPADELLQLSQPEQAGAQGRSATGCSTRSRASGAAPATRSARRCPPTATSGSPPGPSTTGTSPGRWSPPEPRRERPGRRGQGGEQGPRRPGGGCASTSARASTARGTPRPPRRTASRASAAAPAAVRGHPALEVLPVRQRRGATCATSSCRRSMNLTRSPTTASGTRHR